MSSDDSSSSDSSESTQPDYDSGEESSSDSSEKDENFDFDPFSERQIDLNIDKLLPFVV